MTVTRACGTVVLGLTPGYLLLAVALWRRVSLLVVR